MRNRGSCPGFVAILWTGIAAGQSVANWPAPSSWSRAGQQGRMTTMDVTPPLPFVGVAPCRIADTRGNGFTGAYGPPALAAGSPRNFTLSGQCGIPSGAGAVSLNITVTNTAGPGFIKIFPQGGASPVVSTLNYSAGQTVANAAVVPLGTGGGVTVAAGVSGTQLIIDTNGYYASTPAATADYFKIINSGLYALYGQTSSASENSAGVYGSATATTGITYGVWGDDFSSSAFGIGVLGISHATTGQTYGVFGRTNSTTDGATGTYGEAVGAFGATSGVQGVSLGDQFNTAGVKGVGSGEPGDAGTLNFRPAGVRGDSSSGLGVLGYSQENAVAGSLTDGAGNLLAEGSLGLNGGIAGDSTTGNWSVFAFGMTGATGSKHFVEPHPTDAAKEILYASLEGREVGTYFRDTSRTVDGQATISVPPDFRMVTADDGLTVQVTPVGDVAAVGVISKSLDQIVIRSSKDVSFDYFVQGVRKGYEDFEPVQSGRREFVPRSARDRTPAYLNAEQKRKLIANGTYNADGTVNMATAERLGWVQAWADREARAREAGEKARAEAVSRR